MGRFIAPDTRRDLVETPANKKAREEKENEQERLMSHFVESVKDIGSERFYGEKDAEKVSPKRDPENDAMILRVRVDGIRREHEKRQKECENESRREDKWVKKSRQQDMFQEVDKRIANSIGTKDELDRYDYFCREHHNDGTREYCASKHDWWQRYKLEEKCKRHYYELLREDTPCHLYFDLEYSKKANPDIDGEKLVDRLVELLEEELRTTDEIDASAFDPKEHVVELDSSNDGKFSRHLVVQLPARQVFLNNSHCVHFVRKLWARIESRRKDDSLCDAMFVHKELGDDRVDSFIDLGVYSRNRVFRLYLSSKRTAPGEKEKPRLLPTGRFWSNPDASSKEEPDKETFERSRAAARGTIEALNMHSKIQFEGVNHSSVLRGKTFQGYRTGSFSNSKGVGGNSIGPCPRTASFVCEDFNGWSGHGGAAIRSWTAFPEYGVLVLNLFGNRFCENVERAHKSNNVMFVIDFREEAYYQRCHDPDCRGTRGPWHKLRDDLVEESYELLKLLPPSFDDVADDELSGIAL